MGSKGKSRQYVRTDVECKKSDGNSKEESKRNARQSREDF